MINFINQIINGLSTGSMYALVAIGYTLATFLWYCENDQLCPW